MVTLYAISIWLHVVAATAWVGSMIFFSTIVVPILRRRELATSASSLIPILGPRYRVLGWISLGVLVVTGVANLHFRGIGWDALASRDFWSTPYGRALGWKLVLVVIVLALTAAHEALRKGRAASWLGRSLLLASLAILFFATAMVRGLI